MRKVLLFTIFMSFGVTLNINSQTLKNVSIQTEKRIALVIGNSNYTSSILPNPENDARAIADVLQKLGFVVFKYENLSQSQMKRAIDDFGLKLKKGDVGLFYYAGHGIQAKGFNYLIPVDAELQTEEQVDYDCVRADRVLSLMEVSGAKVNIIILDACRNNPFERSWTRSVSGRGLATMNAPKGTLIAYSTAPGNIASDGNGGNSPYTSALIQSLQIPNITIMQVFQIVRNMVAQRTQNQQVPWESTSLIGDFYFTNTAPVKMDNPSQNTETEILQKPTTRSYSFEESKNDWKAEGLTSNVSKQTIYAFRPDSTDYSFSMSQTFNETGQNLNKSFHFQNKHLKDVWFLPGNDTSLTMLYFSGTNRRIGSKIYSVSNQWRDHIESRNWVSENVNTINIELFDGLIKRADTIFYENGKRIKSIWYSAEIKKEYSIENDRIVGMKVDSLLYRFITSYEYGKNGLLMTEKNSGYALVLNKTVSQTQQKSTSKRSVKNKTQNLQSSTPEIIIRNFNVFYNYLKFDNKGNWIQRDVFKADGTTGWSQKKMYFQTAEYNYY